MKCESQDVCGGNEADHVCKDCGKKYCQNCGMVAEWICDCCEPQNIVEMKTTPKTSKGKDK